MKNNGINSNSPKSPIASSRREKPNSTKPHSSINKKLKKDFAFLVPPSSQNETNKISKSTTDNREDKNPTASPNKKHQPLKKNHSKIEMSSPVFDLDENPNLQSNNPNGNYDEFEQQSQINQADLSPGVTIGRDGCSPVSPTFVKQKYKNMLTPYEMSEIMNYPEVYFIGNSLKKKVQDGSFDDEKTFHYIAKAGDHIAYRYEILSGLGKGVFGSVHKCIDHKTKEKVAVKIIVNTPIMQKQGHTEVENMKILNETANSATEIKEPTLSSFPNSMLLVRRSPVKRSSSGDSHSTNHLNSSNNNKDDEDSLLLSSPIKPPANPNMKHVVQLIDSFVFRNHVCIVTEILGESLYDYMKSRTKSKQPNKPTNSSSTGKTQQQQELQLDPLPMQMVRAIAFQIMDGLASIHRKKIIHGDLKPENILFTESESDQPKKKKASKSKGPNSGPCHLSPPRSTPRGITSCFNTTFSVIENLSLKRHIKIIDFGSSCRQNVLVFNYLQSRFYRAPEVVLGAYYGPGIDVWSAGCIIAEIFVGRPLFPASSEVDLLARFIETLGAPPQTVIQMQADFHTKAAQKVAKSKNGALNQAGSNKTAKAQRNKFFSDDGKLYNLPDQPVPLKTRLSSFLKSSDSMMLDFLSKCLEWDKDKRLSAAKLCKHPWISSFSS